MRKLKFFLAMSLLGLALLEGCFYLMSIFVIPKMRYYSPPTIEEFSSYLSRADSRLGWLPRAKTAANGSRFAPAAQGFDEPCVSLYGDSFTWGEEVSDEDAWGNVLTSLLGCRVDNYGVAGYGSDQAYLRFRYNEADRAPVVILSHSSDNIMRNVNQDFSLVYLKGIHLHPVFTRDGDGRLRVIEAPRLTPDDYRKYVEDVGQYLEHEYFLPNATPHSRRTLYFPYTVSVARLYLNKRLYQSAAAIWLGGPPWYAEFYEPTHPSGALALTVDILTQFSRDARARGKAAIVLLLPTARVLNHFRHSGTWIYQRLEDALEERGVQVYDTGPALLPSIGDGDLCEYFCRDSAGMRGHYNAKGNRALALIVRDILVDSGMLPAGSDPPGPEVGTKGIEGSGEAL